MTIKITGLSFKYEKREETVLQNIDLDIHKGQYVAIIGPNGCGKTTLIKHFNGLLSPGAGDVFIDGINTRDSKALPKIRQKLGMVFQNPDSQIVGMSVEEDVAFGPGNLQLPSAEIRRRLKNALQKVGLSAYAHRAPHTLSSGEKQLVAIAGVLAMEPDHIILDEPTAHLAPFESKRILKVLKGLHSQGLTVVHVSHDVDELVDAQRIILMDGGRVRADGGPAEIFTRIDYLQELGLEVPKITELVWRLRESGINLRPDILTLEQACEEITALIFGTRNSKVLLTL
jgi:biotin transport system ATP-binding protein/energy-coupling factor transport system ATP-binding protein